MSPRHRTQRPPPHPGSHTSRAIVVKSSVNTDSSDEDDASTPNKARRLNSGERHRRNYTNESFDSFLSSELFDNEHSLDCQLASGETQTSPSPSLMRSTTSSRFMERQSIEIEPELDKSSPLESPKHSKTTLTGPPHPVTPDPLGPPSGRLGEDEDLLIVGTAPSSPDESDPFEPTWESTTKARSRIRPSAFNKRCLMIAIVLVCICTAVVVAALLVLGGSSSNGAKVEATSPPGDTVDDVNVTIPYTNKTESPQDPNTDSNTKLPRVTAVPTFSLPPPTPPPAPSAAPSSQPTLRPTVPPLNDACQYARGPLTINGSPVEGLLSDLVPPMDLTETCLGDSTSSTDVGLWYAVTGGDEVLRAFTCGSSEEGDTRISIYQGDCPDSNHSRLQCVVANDDFCGRHASVSWYAQKGVYYYIFVHSADADGSFKMRVTYEDNGFCDNAIGPIDNDGKVITIGSLRGADLERPTTTCFFNHYAEFGYVWYMVRCRGGLFLLRA
jgi:hypothetical protein